MKLLLLAAAAAPLTEGGGLAEAVGGLARALAAPVKHGHDVRVVLPFTGRIDRARWSPRPVTRVGVPHLTGDLIARVHQVVHAGVTYYLVAGPPIPRGRARADLPAEAAIFTALAALGLCRALGWTPDVLHGHDALSGPALYWLGTDGLHDPLFQGTASVLTLYEITGRLLGAGRSLLQYGLTASDAPGLPDRSRDTLLGLGLAHADSLVVPSEVYARDVQTAGYGHGLEDLLRARGLTAIPAVPDTSAWDPARDRHLTARFSAASLERRAANKRALQTALGLPRSAAALVGLIFDGADADGAGPALGALRRLLSEAADVQVLVVGGPPAVRALTRAHPDRVRALDLPDVSLEHRLHAAADLLCVPTRSAPTGLAALRALRYGAVPVAAAAGAHTDHIVDQSVVRRGTGFLYTGYNEAVLLAALQRALRLYAQPQRWRSVQQRGMRQAERASGARGASHAAAHLALYQQAITHRKEAVTRRARLLAEDPAAPAPGLPAAHGSAMLR